MGLFRRQQPPVRQARLQGEDDGFVFRRSRTLTGSLSPDVASSTESRGQLKTPRLKAQELKKHRRLLGSGLGIVLMAIIGCVWLLDQYVVTAQTVTTPQQLSRKFTEADYQVVIDEYLKSRPAERFLFLLNQERLNTFVKEKKPEVLSLRLENGPGLASASATVAFRSPVAMWQVEETRLYVDAGGEAFSINYFAEPSVVVADESGIDPSQQRAIAPIRLLRFIGQVVSGLDQSGVGTVSQVTIPGGTLRQLDVTLVDRPYRIKTHIDREAEEQVTDVVAAVTHLDKKDIKPAYLDARVKGKAFYRN